MGSILVVEDEEHIASFVERGLRAAGYAVKIAPTGTTGLALALTDEFDLMVLDVGLPGIDGFDVLKRLRAQGNTMPVIVLTARREPSDTVAALDGGADDYLAKPFALDVLLARIRLRLRSTDQAEAYVLSRDGLTIDIVARRVEVDGTRVELSAREFALVEEFMRHPDQVLSREQLLSRVWGYDFDPGSNVVEVYVGYLRSKLGAERIITVRGMGYRLK